MKKLTAILATLLLLISFSNDAFAGKGDKKAKKNKKAKTEQATEQVADTSTVSLENDTEELTNATEDSVFDAALAQQAQEAQITANQALIDSLVKAGNAANTEEIEELKASIQRIKNANAGNAQRITDLKSEVETVSSTASNAESAASTAQTTAEEAKTATDTLTRQANKLEGWVKETYTLAKSLSTKITNTQIAGGVFALMFIIFLWLLSSNLAKLRGDTNILIKDFKENNENSTVRFSTDPKPVKKKPAPAQQPAQPVH